MKQTHTIKTWMPYFQDIIDGKKPFEFRLNDRNFQEGDEIKHIEWNSEENKETGRQCWATITYMVKGGMFGIPDNYCLFAQHTNMQTNFIRDFVQLQKVIDDYENKLSYKYGGNITEKLSHVLSKFNEVATESVWKGKNFLEDVKTQFKAIELMLEGLSSEAYNHRQKRVIANHVVNMIRSNIDRIDRTQFEFSSRMYEHYNYFRSESPEGDLLRRYKDLVQQNKYFKEQLGQKDPQDQAPVPGLPF